MSATVADPCPRAGRPSRSASRRPGAAWRFWRSPAGQPPWARPALLATAVVAAVLYAWNITSSGFALYYSDAVKSMSVSWKALLFGAMDPGATITPDKIPGSFVPQALSARLFGFHAWSVTLPQCVEGVICVLVLHRVVRRWAGPVAGITAAALFTCTPVVASMFGHSMEDGGLTFCLVMAADCAQRALLDARLRSLVLSGVWVGLGFQAKMLQAWMVLPALATAYLVAAPVRLRRRVGHLLVAGVVCLAVSLSWVVMMTVVPAKDRPYVDGSTDNSAFAMVFGYNGLERFGIHVPGSVASTGSGGAARGTRPGGTASWRAGGFGGAPFPGTRAPGNGVFPAGGGKAARNGGTGEGTGSARPFAGGRGGPGAPGGGPGGMDAGPSWLKLFQSRFAPQIGWLYPFALLTLVLGVWWRRRAGRGDRTLGGLVLWGGWLVVVGVVFSAMGSIPHTAYMATLAPPLAALTAAGAVLMRRAYRAGGPRGWALPVAVAAEAVWSWYLSSFHPDFLPWLKWLTAAACLAGVAAMVLGRVTRRTRSRLVTAGVLAGLAGAVVTPVAWSASVLDPAYAGSAFDAGAGPSAMGGGRARAVPGAAGASRGGPGGDITTRLTADERKLYAYVKSRQGGARYVLATDGWNAASPYILATGDTVLPMGGFSGSVPHPSPGDFTALVRGGRLRFVLLSGSGGGFPGRGGTAGATGRVRTWVRAHCAAVPSARYGVTTTQAFGGGGTLYECAPERA
ncbi:MULTISPECIES: ArnT family glycosyltransferase [Streptomycetaceae]|uniref:Mannosyltransferase n=1 Tax=Streptantibioticus cattleyicolor (strain ATCC 35852 / DSM 46488 / JCM 4925 / NBRC 14057 / NRRL 8057) TaxID=1003195 RepID=G8X3J8_STREN|nr:glycosyltransferase family 39 protein [Streptantibioticus cattleyicolor]AEW97371.1 hypothetical protein SCATT_50000 [Streptantibioticus cattleyicolor NRRL 8057 = DSM 46488]